MNRALAITLALIVGFSLASCERSPNQEFSDSAKVNAQQAQYAKGQPVPAFDWSLERDLVIKLYNLRNSKVATHAVWRSDYGMIEGDCPCLGYGIPYDISLTNPLQETNRNYQSNAVIEQAEPNGLFASKNTSATWVMCIGDAGSLDPVYVEGKVTIFPYPVTVDYDRNRVHRAGKSTAGIARPQEDKRGEGRPRAGVVARPQEYSNRGEDATRR